VNWRTHLEEFCVGILRAERQGEPFVTIGNKPRPVMQRNFLVERLIPAGRPTILYGPWANGKGWVSVGICVAVAAGIPLAGLRTQQGPILYLDWEDDEDTFSDRVWMVSRGLGLTEPPPNMYYRACRGALSSQVHQIARFVDEHGVTLTATDSEGLAGGMPGERGSYEDTALTLFEGLRHIRSTHLLIDHVSEEGRQNQKTVGKAYGSIYKMALVRNAWEIRKEQDLGASAFQVALYHTKANHGPLLKPLGLSIDFAMMGACAISVRAIEDSAELSVRLPVHERITALLGAQLLTAKEIAEPLGLTEAHARKELHRNHNKFAQTADHKWFIRSKHGMVRDLATNGTEPVDVVVTTNGHAPWRGGSGVSEPIPF
jgi:hypothetical protein